ncbi:prepilin-type N-terminal cleavage/methylation domain-containing protein [Thermodesulfobacteriota bacterium]
MLKIFRKNDKKGFTLIELMIVIAIIGILAAIAIPNFISYRNKAFCSKAETDAKNILAAVSDYFSEPEHTALPGITDLIGFAFSTDPANTGNLTAAGNDPNRTITATVTDVSGRCPRGSNGVYQESMPRDSANDGWS